MSVYEYTGQEVNYQLIADIVQLLEENGIPCLLIGDYMYEAMGSPALRGVSQLPDLILTLYNRLTKPNRTSNSFSKAMI